MENKIEILKNSYQLVIEDLFKIIDKYQEAFIEKNYFLSVYVNKVSSSKQSKVFLNISDLYGAKVDENGEIINRQVSYSAVKEFKTWSAVKNELIDLEEKSFLRLGEYDFNLLSSFLTDLNLHKQPVDKVPFNELVVDLMDVILEKMKNVDNLLIFLKDLKTEVEQKDIYKKELKNINERLEGLSKEKEKVNIRTIVEKFIGSGSQDLEELVILDEKKKILEKKLKDIKYKEGVRDTVEISLLRNYMGGLYSFGKENNLVDLYKLLYTIKDSHINNLVMWSDTYCKVKNITKIDFINKLIGSSLEAMNGNAYQNFSTNEETNEKIKTRELSNLCGLNGLLSMFNITNPEETEYTVVNNYIYDNLMEYVKKIKNAPFVFKDREVFYVFRKLLDANKYGSYGLENSGENVQEIMNFFKVKIEDLRLYNLVHIEKNEWEIRLIRKNLEHLYIKYYYDEKPHGVTLKLLNYLNKEEKIGDELLVKNVTLFEKDNQFHLKIRLNDENESINKEFIKNTGILLEILDKKLCENNGKKTRDRTVEINVKRDGVFEDVIIDFESVKRKNHLENVLEKIDVERDIGSRRKKI